MTGVQTCALPISIAARPLLAVLNEDHKRAAGTLAQEMGLGEVVMAAMK